MIIPRQIKLMGHTIDVVWVDTLVHSHDALGFSDYRNQQIILQKSSPSYYVPHSVIEQIYLHEVLHFILTALGESELRSNEKLVDSIAGLLNQVLNSVEEDDVGYFPIDDNLHC